MPTTTKPDHRLRRHADYQRVYRDARRNSGRQMSWFAALRRDDYIPATESPRIGITIPKAIGNAVVRNRIKRRLRALIARHITVLTLPIDVVLHPRRTAAEIEFSTLDADLAQIFARIQKDFSQQAK